MIPGGQSEISSVANDSLDTATSASWKIRHTERLIAASIEASVGSVGDAYDNALAEAINGLFKTAGNIEVSLDHAENDMLSLTISDDGLGLQKSAIEEERQGGIGMNLVKNLTAQIGGKYRIENQHGIIINIISPTE